MVTLTKHLLCAEHRSQHVPRQHLTEPLVEAAKEAGSANPPSEGRGASEKGRDSPCTSCARGQSRSPTQAWAEAGSP